MEGTAKKYRILSLDGGGLRGVITARFLQRLVDTPAISGWLEQADLIVGTSTGGLLALALAQGTSPGELVRFYLDRGGAIFDDSIWDDVLDMGKLIGADYSNGVLKAELERLFGDRVLSDLPKKVAIPAFDLHYHFKKNNNEGEKEIWKPKIFHNFNGKGSDGGRKAAKVALYTCSAPTYFPSADGYIDGGVFANNPSMVAIAQAISRYNEESERASLDEIVLLSVGTGEIRNYIRGDTLDWGLGQWMRPLIDVMMEGTAGIADYQCYQLLGENYHRLQLLFDEGVAFKIDDVARLDEMERLASAYSLDAATRWIAGAWL